ncbi:MAG: deoxyguanosinetriphosphate triphosphohydrolase family protein [Acidobacteriota bacterium]
MAPRHVPGRLPWPRFPGWGTNGRPGASLSDPVLSGGSPAWAGRTRGRLEELEESRLAPWALRSAGATRRHGIDPEGRTFDFRTEFQRDRDRIVHSRAFRRLRQKTQVYLPDRSDHFRNRLIHTLEVAGLARTLARALALNEDLTEGIALGHDLGHSAFGHAGESVLNGVLTGSIPVRGVDPAVARRCGGFKHNYQSLRVVDLLEIRYRHPGLDLTDAVREGILKHTALRSDVSYPDLNREGLALDMAPALEAQVVALADEIAQQVHDLDDGIQDGVVELAEVESLGIVQEVVSKLAGSWAGRGRFHRVNLINRGIVHLLVTSAAIQTAARIGEWAEREGVTSPGEFTERRRSLPAGLVQLSPPVRGLFGQLKKFVYRRVIQSFAVHRSDARARQVFLDLLTAYHADPLLLEDHVLLRVKEKTGGRFLRDLSPAAVPEEIRAHFRSNPIFLRLLADHLAGMTDTFALAEHERLHRAGVSPAAPRD